MAEPFGCFECGALIADEAERIVEVDGRAYFVWRCPSCNLPIGADVDGHPIYDDDIVELVIQDDPNNFDASVGDRGTVGLSNHVIQEGGVLVMEWGGFYPPSHLRLIQRGRL